jgi:salicylate biosynthesis isochorismate synthase
VTSRLVVRTRALEGSPDLVDVVTAARDAGHESILVEHPMPDAASVAGLGRVFDIVSTGQGVRAEAPEGDILAEEIGTGPARLAARLWELLAPAPGRPGDVASATAVGGFAFRTDREPGGAWTGFPAVLLRVPALLLLRQRGRTWSVAATLSREGESPVALEERLDSAEELLRLPRLAYQGAAARRLEVHSVVPVADWQETVGRLALRLRRGEADKVVLAREVTASGDGVISTGAVLRALRASYPSCYVYMVPGADGTALVGATPELLVRRTGRVATCQPMAGSVARGSDAAEDKELAGRLLASGKDRREHAVVVAEMAANLAPIASHIETPEVPEIVAYTNIQHLASTIRADLEGDPAPSAAHLAALLHPTPAVAGRPREAALALIDELEGMERGWYAGAVGWVDARGDGEFAVALRCGLLWEDGARVYAGVGLMPDSDPSAELAETELKLQALLGALAG